MMPVLTATINTSFTLFVFTVLMPVTTTHIICVDCVAVLLLVIAANVIVVTVLIVDVTNATVFGDIVRIIVVIGACHVVQRYSYSPPPPTLEAHVRVIFTCLVIATSTPFVVH